MFPSQQDLDSFHLPEHKHEGCHLSPIQTDLVCTQLQKKKKKMSHEVIAVLEWKLLVKSQSTMTVTSQGERKDESDAPKTLGAEHRTTLA